MSMRVMQVKYNAKRKASEVNAKKGKFSLAFTGTGKVKGKCCENAVGIPKQAITQQSYGVYTNRATLGLSGLSRKVTPNNTMLIYKRPHDFSSKNLIENKRCKTLRCDHSSCSPKPDAKCYGLSDKKNGNYTKDLGFLSASDQINKKLALRAGTDLNSKYESDMMKNRTGLRC